MRRLLIAGWLLVPVGAWAYHEGPGQEGLQLDLVDEALSKARASVAVKDWEMAVDHYEAALKDLPAERVTATRKLRLAIAQSKMLSKELVPARESLAELVTEMTEDPAADPAVLEEARQAYASAQYYVTWLMRLEGYPREAWEPEVEIARQTYRLLAEQADDAGNAPLAQARREDLESAVKLARLDLQELQGLPLPSQ